MSKKFRVRERERESKRLILSLKYTSIFNKVFFKKKNLVSYFRHTHDDYINDSKLKMIKS